MKIGDVSDVKADGADGVANGKVVAEENGKKERSVLQAKLTRLAIQIGYAGKFQRQSFHIYSSILYQSRGVLFIFTSFKNTDFLFRSFRKKKQF